MGDPIIAGAILDRSLHHSRTINIREESYRPKDSRRAGILRPREQSGARLTKEAELGSVRAAESRL